jgi:hypothetical protein
MSGIQIGRDLANLLSAVGGQDIGPSVSYTEKGSRSGPIGRKGSARKIPANANPGEFLEVVNRLTKWIPAESLAIYVPGVTFLHSGGGATDKPKLWFLVATAVLSPVFTWLTVLRSDQRVGVETCLACALAFIAFLIWSFSVPFNGWQEFRVIAENSGAVAVVSAMAGMLFGQIADILTSWAVRRAKS